MMLNIACNPTAHEQPFLKMGATTFTLSVGADSTFFSPFVCVHSGFLVQCHYLGFVTQQTKMHFIFYW